MVKIKVLCLVAQSCPTLCDPTDCDPPGSSVHGHSPGKNTGVGCHALLQGIFPTQGSNPGLHHCSRVLYHLSHRGSQFIKTIPILALKVPCHKKPYSPEQTGIVSQTPCALKRMEGEGRPSMLDRSVLHNAFSLVRTPWDPRT